MYAAPARHIHAVRSLGLARQLAAAPERGSCGQRESALEGPQQGPKAAQS